MKACEDDRRRLQSILDYASAHVGRWIRAYGVPDTDCEDVAQDVMVAVLRRAHTYDPALPLRPWLGTIAFRAARDYRRLARHRRELAWTPGCDCAEAPGPSAEERLHDVQTRRLVREALLAIRPSRRSVLLRYTCDGVDMAEVAAELGIPLNTAYTRLRAARADLRIVWLRRGGPRGA